MHILAKRQNPLIACRLLIPPKAKAKAFVSEVIVIAGPAWPMA